VDFFGGKSNKPPFDFLLSFQLKGFNAREIHFRPFCGGLRRAHLVPRFCLCGTGGLIAVPQNPGHIPNTPAARCMFLITATPKGQRASQLPQATQSEP
jgi:hypothetical protein